jgi:sulfate adenylyltransferase subunit 2
VFFDHHWRASSVAGVQITHLKPLEAASIGIMREVVGEFRNPVMLFRSARIRRSWCIWRVTRFSPSGRIPVVSDRCRAEIREMIAFRDATVRRLGLGLLVHAKEDCRARSGSARSPRVRLRIPPL